LPVFERGRQFGRGKQAFNLRNGFVVASHSSTK
jgi:hypothetical protein